MDNWIFFLGVFVGYLVFSFIPNLIFKIWDKNVNKLETNEARELQKKAYESLHSIKADKPNENIQAPKFKKYLRV